MKKVKVYLFGTEDKSLKSKINKKVNDIQIELKRIGKQANNYKNEKNLHYGHLGDLDYVYLQLRELFKNSK